MRDYVNCLGCGAKSLNLVGETHKYMLSSPGCWAMFGEISAKEYSDIRFARAHQFSVEAYACQHVGKPDDPRAVNSVNIHLASLFMIFEKNLSLAEVPAIRNSFSQYYKGKGILQWLKPPESFGPITVYDVWDNEDPLRHYELSKNWAKSTWLAWSHQHSKIAFLTHQVLK